MPKKTVIITGYTCNNNCVFCYDVEKREKYPDLSTLEVKRRLKEAKESGSEYVDFIGGEFTIRKDAIELISFAKELGFKHIAITTNGRIFSYERIMKNFIEAGVDSIIFSVHGHTAELHDELTGVPGSFRQLKEAISNAHENHLKIFTNTTICSKNYKKLEEIGKLLVSFGVDNAEFIYVDPTTGAANIDFSLVPKIEETSKYVEKVLDIGKEYKIRHWKIRYFPLCYLNGYEKDYVSENSEWFDNEMHFGPEFTNTDVQGSRKIVSRIKVDRCKDCRLNPKCEGIWKRYVDEYGDDEIVPVTDSTPKVLREDRKKFLRGVGIIINSEDEILLFRRIKTARNNGKPYYSLMGGHCDEGEDIKSCVIREVKEETTLDIEIGEELFVLEDDFCIAHYYLAKSFRGVPTLSGEEFDRNSQFNNFNLVWVPLGKLKDINLMPPELLSKLKEYKIVE